MRWPFNTVSPTLTTGTAAAPICCCNGKTRVLLRGTLRIANAVERLFWPSKTKPPGNEPNCLMLVSPVLVPAHLDLASASYLG